MGTVLSVCQSGRCGLLHHPGRAGGPVGFCQRDFGPPGRAPGQTPGVAAAGPRPRRPARVELPRLQPRRRTPPDPLPGQRVGPRPLLRHQPGQARFWFCPAGDDGGGVGADGGVFQKSIPKLE